MEINKYLPFRTRAPSSDAGSITSDIVSRFMDLDLHMTDEEVTDVHKAKEKTQVINKEGGASYFFTFETCY